MKCQALVAALGTLAVAGVLAQPAIAQAGGNVVFMPEATYYGQVAAGSGVFTGSVSFTNNGFTESFALKPSPHITLIGDDRGGQVGGGDTILTNYYFELIQVGGESVSSAVPVDLSYNVTFSGDFNSYTTAAAVIVMGDTACGSVNPAGTCTDVYSSPLSEPAPGALPIGPPSGTLTEFVALNTPTLLSLNANMGWDGFASYNPAQTITADIDPVLSIDPSFAATDPNYLNDFSFAFSQGVGNLPGVPEPASWTLLTVGVAAIGAGLRMRRRDMPASA